MPDQFKENEGNGSTNNPRTRSTRNRSKVLNYKEKGESDSDILTSESRPESPVKTEYTVTKPKKVTKYKMVPYQPVQIPFGFGDKEIESLLSYRVNEGQEEALVKFKYTSYHHLEWLSREYIEDIMPQGKHRFKKLKQNYEFNNEQYDEGFNLSYLEIDRVIDEGEITDDEEEDGLCVYGLVKWEGLPYENSTWEKVSKIRELDNEKYELFIHRQEHPGNEILPLVSRPIKEKFEKLIESPKFKNENCLRDYQLEGLNWLTYCWYNHRSSIMADEMGLGKTVQSVSFIYHIYRTCKIRGPFLIVAPLSTIPHWEREFRAWTDLNVVVYHGSSTSRNIIVDSEFYYKDEEGGRLSELYKMEVLITTYEMILSGAAQLSPIFWRVGVFDEAHRLKNRNSKVLEILRNYNIEHRVLLTGTPLQNSVSELFSLLNFLEPTRFSNEKQFLEEFGDLKSSAEVAELQELLKPIMLRRFKEDVEKSIPSKEETVVEVELTNVQKKWYRAILERNFTYIRRGGKGEGPSLNNIMMELRKCCNHPFLIKGAEELIVKEQEEKGSQSLIQTMIQSSGKLVLLDKLLPKLKANGHKVLIFSQMTKVLDLLAEYLHYRNYETERIDGGVQSSERQIAIDRFTASSTSFTFLLCTRAGGVGINLTAADTVIIFDSDWNPQNDLQAQARVHRIGQTKPVKIYRLLCANTYERQMFDRANLKLGLDKAVMQKMDGYSDTASSSTGLSKKEVDDLLKLGAYGALLDDTESSKFHEEDIDSILERRSTVIKYGSNEKGSAFSKASFSTFDEEKTDLNDPDFWDKWATKAEIDLEQLNEKNPLILDEPRTRKRTKRFEYLENNNNNKDSKNIIDEDSQDEFIEDKSKGPRFWTASGRAKLERKLMIYGLSNWEKLSACFTRRNLPDLRACVHNLIRSMLKMVRSGNNESKDFEEVENALILDQKNHGEEGLDLEHLHNELNIPYPDADKLQIAEFKSFLVEAPAEYLEKIQNKAKSLLQRIQVIYIICEKMVPKEENELKLYKAPDCGNSAPPATWWTIDMDKDLLIGIVKHGYHQYDEFKQDSNLIFSSIKFSSPDSSPIPEIDGQNIDQSPPYKKSRNNSPLNEEEKYYWPLGVDIGLRIRKMIHQFQKVGGMIKNNTKTNSTKNSNSFIERVISSIRNNVDITDQVEMDKAWSAREIKNFLKTISSFGIETMSFNLFDRSWTRFRCVSELFSKDDDDFENYLSQYIRMCYDALMADTGKDVKERNPRVVNFLEELITTLGPNKLKLNLEIPTAEKAKRAIKRIMQMYYLRRKVYENEDFKLILGQSRKIHGMPNWWSHKYEEPFVQALILYGIAGDKFVFLDEELPFTSFDESEWPKEIVITKHIDQLIEISDKCEIKKQKAKVFFNNNNNNNNNSYNNNNNNNIEKNIITTTQSTPIVTITAPKENIKVIEPPINYLSSPQTQGQSPAIHNSSPSTTTSHFLVYDSKDGPILTRSKPKVRNYPTSGNLRPAAIVKLDDDDSQPKITTFFSSNKKEKEKEGIDNSAKRGLKEEEDIIKTKESSIGSINHLLNPTEVEVYSSNKKFRDEEESRT